jgi:hypothetical protein
MESLLGDEEVWSANVEYQLKRGHNVWFDCWIVLKFLQGFPEAVFFGVAMESLLDYEEVWSAILEYQFKGS